jgi:hypothetical protein
MNCKRKHADSNVKAHVRGSSPKCLMIHETGAGISIAVQEMVNTDGRTPFFLKDADDRFNRRQVDMVLACDSWGLIVSYCPVSRNGLLFFM